MFKYKMVPVPKNLASKPGQDLGKALTEYVEKKVNDMAQKGWEFYRSDSYTVEELPGCLAALSGQRGNVESYNLLTFRKSIADTETD